MASRNLSDGDEIRVRYTQAGGKDIGQYGNEGVYGNVQVIMAKNGKRNRKIKNREREAGIDEYRKQKKSERIK